MNTAGTIQLDIVLDDGQPDISAIQKTWMEQLSLKPGGLIAGAYYKGHLGTTEAIARWNGQQLRFVVWVPASDKPKLKGARHVLESGIGDAFAPFELVQVEKEKQISDFDLNTIR